LQKYCPGLLKWFCYGYGRPVGIRDHQGVRVGQAETGIFIGDGFGTIFYCVGAQDYYLEVENALHDLEARRGVPDAQRGFLSIIADDVTIKAKTDIVMELAPVRYYLGGGWFSAESVQRLYPRTARAPSRRCAGEYTSM